MRKRRVDEEESAERWLVSYADFITLLFAFFVVLFATSTADIQKQAEFEKSVVENFSRVAGLLGRGPSFDPSQTKGAIGLAPEQGTDLIERPLYHNPPPVAALSEQILEAIEKRIKEGEGGLAVDLEPHEGGLLITLEEDLLFGGAVTALSGSGQEVIASLAALFNELQLTVDIRGHSDSHQADSWSFANQRARSVLDAFLKAQPKLESLLIISIYGNQRKRWAERTPAERKSNRRIELLLRL